ncbi:MAG: PAS domain-containing protein [Deltaproteobacteria bacterium]|nr:PAS domain-containing protein [Deltaproteobacteria bacterium]
MSCILPIPMVQSQPEVRKLNERIHELEQLVSVIERAKRTWQSTFDAITIPVHIVGPDYRIDRANVAIAAVGGGKITSYPDHVCYEVFAGRTSPCLGCPLQQSLEERVPVTRLLTSAIHDRQFEVTAYPYDETQSIVSYRDVTEEKRLQREVIQQEKMAAIGMLAGGVAHEINNPLGGVLAFTQLALGSVGENESIRSDLEEIRKAAERCKRIVADLLDFSRMSQEGERHPVDLALLIEKILPFLRGEMRSLNVECQVKTHGNVPKVVGHTDRLQQVFLNLMTNACHAMPHGGKLTVELKRGPSSGTVVIVRDTGVGIAVKHLDHIFDPFFTTKEPGKGTGLGLAITYRIVKEHGGTIDVASEEGKGSVFTLSFPGGAHGADSHR